MCHASRMASTSGKYLYSVALPIPVSWAIRDIVTENRPCSATNAAVVQHGLSHIPPVRLDRLLPEPGHIHGYAADARVTR